MGSRRFRRSRDVKAAMTSRIASVDESGSEDPNPWAPPDPAGKDEAKLSSDALTLASDAIIWSKKSTANREVRDPVYSGEPKGDRIGEPLFWGELGEVLPQKSPRPEGGEITTRRHSGMWLWSSLVRRLRPLLPLTGSASVGAGDRMGELPPALPPPSCRSSASRLNPWSRVTVDTRVPKDVVPFPCAFASPSIESLCRVAAFTGRTTASVASSTAEMAPVNVATGCAFCTRARARGSDAHNRASDRTQLARSRSGAWSSSSGRTRKSAPPPDRPSILV